MPADDHPMLVLREGQVERERFPIDQSEIILGRDPAADRQIDAPGISRRHARLYQQGDDYWLEDLGSTNGTFVNHKQISEQALNDGDVIRLGQTFLRFSLHEKGDPAETRVIKKTIIPGVYITAEKK